jgi:hypothetical protein
LTPLGVVYFALGEKKDVRACVDAGSLLAGLFFFSKDSNFFFNLVVILPVFDHDAHAGSQSDFDRILLLASSAA